ncbi:unnamed protein product [Clonostachys solani]|uniref:Uncharacterized protein n=1 Tax=Clonostachys solani TaxID=160281 RepID=A0A9N9Z3W1_9HYPO|nr:unnamed protein product [Clonostachys solani]
MDLGAQLGEVLIFIKVDVLGAAAASGAALLFRDGWAEGCILLPVKKTEGGRAGLISALGWGQILDPEEMAREGWGGQSGARVVAFKHELVAGEGGGLDEAAADGLGDDGVEAAAGAGDGDELLCQEVGQGEGEDLATGLMMYR